MGNTFAIKLLYITFKITISILRLQNATTVYSTGTLKNKGISETFPALSLEPNRPEASARIGLTYLLHDVKKLETCSGEDALKYT